MPSVSMPDEEIDAFFDADSPTNTPVTALQPSSPSASQSTRTIDLTTPMPRSSFKPTGAFTHAHRRVKTRRERVFHRDDPNLICERLDIDEQSPDTPHTSALTHLSRAYAIASYAQSILILVVSMSLCGLLLSFARGLYADVVRKTRVRADTLVAAAAECAAQRAANMCGKKLTPALERLCEEWAACERRGAFAQSDAVSAAVWAEAFAEVVNGFAERISSTAVVLSLAAGVVLAFLISGVAFGALHARLTDKRLVEKHSAARSILKDADWPQQERRPQRKAIAYHPSP